MKISAVLGEANAYDVLSRLLCCPIATSGPTAARIEIPMPIEVHSVSGEMARRIQHKLRRVLIQGE